MPAYVVIDGDGFEVKRGHCPDSMLDLQAGDGQTVMTHEPSPDDPERFMLVDDILMAAPPIVIPVPVLTYAELRAAAYPSFADQFDQIYHEGLEAWKETITAVKAEFPKPPSE